MQHASHPPTQGWRGLPAEPAHERNLLLAFWSLLFVMIWVQFSGAWLYPTVNVFQDGTASESVQGRAFGVPYQYTLWLLVMLAIGLRVVQGRLAPILTAAGIFVPFLLVAGIASVLGHNPGESIRLSILWTICIVCGLLMGQLFPAAVLLRRLLWLMLLTLATSVVVALAVPALGRGLYGTEEVWRGLFTNKNAFGLVCAICLVVALQARHIPALRALSRAVMLFAFVGLWFSSSLGALLSALLVALQLRLARNVQGRVMPGVYLAGVGLLLVCVLLLAPLVLPLVLDALGRDITLTGRTVVWATYGNAMLDAPLLGQGPGAFTGLSPFTLPLANQLREYGAILTPHSFYLAVFGDLGVAGLFAVVPLLFWLGVWRPLVTRQIATGFTAGIALLMMIQGAVETGAVVSPGLLWFLLALFWSMGLQPRALWIDAPPIPSRAPRMRVSTPIRSRPAPRLGQRPGKR